MKTVQKKKELKTDITHEYRCKHPYVSEHNLAIYKRNEENRIYSGDARMAQYFKINQCHLPY